MKNILGFFSFGGVLLDYDHLDAFNQQGSIPMNSQKFMPEIRSRIARDRKSKHDLFTKPHFQPLCETHRKLISFANDLYFDYRPSHYEEIYCVHPFLHGSNQLPNLNVSFYSITLLNVAFVQN